MNEQRGISIEPEAGVWSLTLMAWGGLISVPIPVWLKALLILMVGVTNTLLIKEVRRLKSISTNKRTPV